MQKSMYRTSEVEFARCPFCRNRLSFREQVKRKMRKKFMCSNCKKVVDERFKIL